MHPQDTLNNVKQESNGYAYGNGRADRHAKQRNTKHTPELEHIRLDTTGHSHLQHLPLIPSMTQPPHWVPEDTPYRDQERHYHYPTPMEQLATTLGNLAKRECIPRLKDSVRTPLYYTGRHSYGLPAHLL